MIFNNKSAKMLSEHFYDDTDSELVIKNNGKEYRITEMYENISPRLGNLEIIDEMVEMYPQHREKLNPENV